MAGKPVKTNAMRLLEAANLAYRVECYDFDEESFSGIHVAQALGLPVEQAFKTLVGRGDKSGPAVFVIPVAEELDLKKAAALSGNKHLELLHVKELPALTGYPRGACTPLAMKKAFPTYFDETALLFDEITLSAGIRGQMLRLDPTPLLALLGAKTGDILAL